MDAAVLDRFELPSSLGAFAQETPLLAGAVVAILVALLGSLLGRGLPRTGRVLRLGGNLALAAVLAMTTLQVIRFSHPEFDLALPQLGLPEQRVEGAETHVQLGKDGHYWVEAKVNGDSRRFLVDTGATVTAVSEDIVEESGITADRARMPVQLRTANGSVAAQLATIDELSFGNIVARDLDAVIAPGMGGMNVLGMNFLSRLKGWRVEDGVLILVPHHPQPVDSAA